MSRTSFQNTIKLDKSFNEHNTRNYVMSALLDRHGFTACVYVPDRNKVIGLLSHSFEHIENEGEISEHLLKLLDDYPWLSFPFLRISFIYRCNSSTLVPLPLFQESNAPLYLEFNHPYSPNNRIVFDKIKHSDAVNVYSIPKILVEKVKTSWPNVLLKHAASCLIENLHVLVKNQNVDNSLFLDVARNSFDLVYFKDNKLHFYNQFAFNTREDFIYFLLTTIEQLQLNPETVELQLSGNIDKNDALFEIVYRYIRQLSFIGRNDNISYSYVLDEMKAHQHFILLSSLQCE